MEKIGSLHARSAGFGLLEGIRKHVASERQRLGGHWPEVACQGCIAECYLRACQGYKRTFVMMFSSNHKVQVGDS
eukprot:6471244-Amphidinium_carterae.3